MAKNTKHKHLKHQKEAAAAGEEKRIIHITHALNKYSGIDALSTFKLELCFCLHKFGTFVLIVFHTGIDCVVHKLIIVFLLIVTKKKNYFQYKNCGHNYIILKK